jgi:D-3-phosphoglycerate dehydrogenase
MAVRQVMNFLENGNIVNSVNFPNCDMGVCSKEARITILHKNIPNTIGQLTAALSKENINISDMLNRSRGEYAYTMFDLDHPVSQAVVADIKNIPGVLRVRVIC